MPRAGPRLARCAVRIHPPRGHMRKYWKLLSVAVLATAACGGQASSALTGNEDFASVSKDANAGAAAGDDSFYLAINKSELGKKYFLSAYITQYFPGAVAYGA